VNDTPLGSFLLGTDWSESAARVPASLLRSGENTLCLELEDAAPGAAGERLGARVSRIVIH